MIEQLKDVDIKFDVSKGMLYLDGHHVSKSFITAQSWFENLIDKGKTKDETFKLFKEEVIKLKSFDSKKEKEEKKSSKNQEQDSKILDLVKEGYLLTPKGQVKDLIHNYIVALKDKECPYCGKFSFNEFNSSVYIDGRKIQNIDYDILLDYLCQKISMDKKSRLHSAIQLVARENSFHPIKQFFENGQWDGVSRVDDFFIKFLGAKDCDIVRALTKKWFVSMVFRTYNPGSPNANILIIIDPRQGTGKTTIFERICNAILKSTADTQLLLKINSGIESSSKDLYLYISDSLIGLFDELAAINKADPDFVKSFVSQNAAKIRKPYGIETEVILFSLVWAATTNQLSILRDKSAELSDDDVERRMWTFLCSGEVHDKKWWDKNLTDEYIKQVLYEAYYIYKTDKDFDSVNLTLQEREELRELQREHKTSNDDNALEYVKSILERYYAAPLGYKSRIDEFIRQVRDTDNSQYVGQTHIYKIDSIYPTQLSTILQKCYNQNRGVAACGGFLKQLGWRKESKKVSGTVRSVYFRPDDTNELFQELVDAEEKKAE